MPGKAKSLTLHGPDGAGKTHLLIAMGNNFKTWSNYGTALYLDAPRLLEVVSTSSAYEEIKTSLHQYENSSFLAVDHLEKVAGNAVVEDQVFHLYNAVVEAGGLFAAAVNAPPSRWGFQEWLSTRLLWGLTVELNPVGDDARAKVLGRMAEGMGLALPEKVALWLMSRLPRDPASQMEALGKIDQYSLIRGKKVSIQLAREALEIN